jgi:catechol 2,3-dioxygenase-like lactoylglutathione lyase family enzyme
MIKSLDHFVLTTDKLDECLAFYTGVLGMELERYGTERLALKFGSQKINVHQPGLNASLVAQYPRAGSLDLCFLADGPLDDVIATLEKHGVPIIRGPVVRAGACFPIRSVYVRDPDQNLVEISEPAA